jgi:hypothetical protein
MENKLTEREIKLLKLVYQDAHKLYTQTANAGNYLDRARLIRGIHDRIKELLGEDTEDALSL